MAWFGQSCFAVTLLHKVPHHGVSTCVRLEHKAWLRTSKLRSEAAQSLAGAATAPLAPVSSSAAEDEEKALITREYDRQLRGGRRATQRGSTRAAEEVEV